MNTKIFITSLAVCISSLLPTFSVAQSSNYLWATSAGGTSSDIGNSITSDANGNVLVTGNFASPIITFGSTTLTNTGGNDIFIVKYDSSGNVLWATSAGGTGADESKSIAVDANGNVLVIGHFTSLTITVGATTLTNTNGSTDIFIVKYDSSGNVLWATSAGGIFVDWGTSISADAGGNVLVTGFFSSPTIIFGSDTLTNVFGSDVFIVKYNPSGSVLWAIGAGGSTYSDEGRSIATDANGNVLVTGSYASNPITFGTTTLANTGAGDIFIVKYDSIGNVLWAKSAGGTSNDWGTDIATDAAGNVLITGWFTSDTLIFGTTIFTNPVPGSRGIFNVKYDSIGNVLWAKGADGSAYVSGSSIATDAVGNVLVTGDFNSPNVIFGTITLTNASFINSDIFIVKYDPSGNVLWANSAGGTTHDYGYSIATDANGNVMVTGIFNSPSITFGTTTLTNAGPSISYSDVFIVKLGAGATGLAENSLENGLSIFPNPFSTQVTLRTDNYFNNATLLVDNIFGQTVKQIKNVSGQKITLQMNNLPSGLYFVRLTEENKIIAEGKLVITNK